MIRLCYANRTEALLAALTERLAEARAAPGASLFAPTHLVVPNRNVETYVKLGVARALGVAANIETWFLRGFLADVARRTAAAGAGGEAAGPAAVEIIDRPQLQGELLALLQDDRFLASRDLAPVRDYLAAAGAAADAVDLRRYQLSAELAALFDDYAFSRPEMLHAWREGRLAEGPEPVMQRWQRELWLGIFGRGGALETRTRRDGRRRLTLAALFEEAPAEPLRLPPAVHVFGISYVARLYRRIFAALAQATALHIYTLNPCREFWEDLEAGPRRARAADKRKFPPRRAPEQLVLGGGDAAGGAADDGAENPLLSLWGRPGRDNIRLLNQLSECDFDARFADPVAAAGGGPARVLHHLQRDILDRVPARASDGRLALDDDSVTVLACPDPRRELETIAAEIWRLVRADETLRFNEIALLVPGRDAAARLAMASAVFREASDLPHSVADLPLPGESRVAEAIDLLLALPLGNLIRQDLLRLLMHPAVAGPGVDAGAWLALCDDLGIVHGADRGDHAGTYIDRDVFNWDQGLRRLALGAWMAGPRSGDQRVFHAGPDRYLPEEPAPDGALGAARFGRLARARLAHARQARAGRRTLREWMAFLRAAVGRTITPADADDRAALLRCLGELQPLEEIGPPELQVGYRVACELARAALGRLTARRGQYLAEGVTISSFLPMRAVPFRAIFIAGLNEGDFPVSERAAPLDLRAQAPRPGDVSARAQDQYMFLEALLCARERLCLSYVACDPVTGEARAPSSVLLDLLAVLEAGYWAPDAAARSARRPPLRRHEDDGARAVLPAAAREAAAAALAADLTAAIAGGAPAGASGDARPDWREARQSLAAPAWRDVAAALGWVGPPPAQSEAAAIDSVPAAPRSITLTTAQLRRFLECPLQGSAAVLLRLGEAEDDAEAAFREDEDFEPAVLRATTFLRDVFGQALRAGPTTPDDAALARAYDQAAERQILQGALPLGTFGAVARQEQLDRLRVWRDGLLRLHGADLPAVGRVFFGHAGEYEDSPRILPAVTLDLAPAGARGPLRVNIHGASELGAERGGERVTLLLPMRDRRDANHDERELLRAFLDHVMVSAIGAGPARPTRALILRPATTKGGKLRDEVSFRALSPVQARGYLDTLVGDLLGGVHDYLLPLEPVVAWRNAKEDPKPSLPEVVAQYRDDGWVKIRSDFGPVHQARRYPPPSDEEGRAMIARRLGLFFDGRLPGAIGEEA